MARQNLLSLGILAFVCALILVFLPPISQDLAYHDFADKRPFLGLPNFGDVASNVPFCLVGIWGFWLFWQKRFNVPTREERIAAAIVCIGFFWVGLGSGYYHWAPSNTSLVWDRLPMTVGFMAVFSLIIMERVSLALGWHLLPIALAFGGLSVAYWHMMDDLRPYVFVQFFPMLAIPFLLWRCQPRYDGVRYLGWTLFWYVAAKVLEHFDKAIFSLLDGAVSGHSLKHLAAALATACFIRYLEKRKTISAV